MASATSPLPPGISLEGLLVRRIVVLLVGAPAEGAPRRHGLFLCTRGERTRPGSILDEPIPSYRYGGQEALMFRALPVPDVKRQQKRLMRPRSSRRT
jgi:hypothetical protein